jgi:putative hydrolase of the HAD superfamily
VGTSFAACGVAGGPILDAAFEDIFGHFAEPHAWIVYPDVEPALERLRAIGTTLAVVSNFDGRLAPLLAAKGLAHHFSAIVVSSEHGAAKPDPVIFRVALRACDADPRSTLHVGDSVDHDLRGAREAGLVALLIDRDATADAHTISSLLDLPARLG